MTTQNNKAMTKAPTIPHEKLKQVAIAATALMFDLNGDDTMYAEFRKRSIQWRVKFSSEKRKANAHKRQFKTHMDSFGLSKNKIAAKIGQKNYDMLMARAYTSAGIEYIPSHPTEQNRKPMNVEAPTISKGELAAAEAAVSKGPRLRAQKPKAAPATANVTPAELDKLVAGAAA